MQNPSQELAADLYRYLHQQSAQAQSSIWPSPFAYIHHHQHNHQQPNPVFFHHQAPIAYQIGSNPHQHTIQDDLWSHTSSIEAYLAWQYYGNYVDSLHYANHQNQSFMTCLPHQNLHLEWTNAVAHDVYGRIYFLFSFHKSVIEHE